MPLMKSTSQYDIIVVGAGHGGCEAALAAARMGQKTLLLTMNIDSVAQMSCNPAIGGLAKGHIVREIDILGGEMAKVTDQTGIQFRMLNLGKGPAVWAPRAQSDKKLYQWTMKNVIESQASLDLKQGEVKSLIIKNKRIHGVITSIKTTYYAHSVIITAGTFLNGLIHIGDVSFGGGRAGDRPSEGLSGDLREMGFEVLRLKTGTPCRLNARSINYDILEPQYGDENPQSFSHFTEQITQPQIPCHITYTNERTHEIINSNLHRSPLHSGRIKGTGPRYCPSIEDKIVRFADKDKHQIFLEPEGRMTQEVYVNGLSTSLPQDVQIDFIRSIKGLENAQLMRFGYAVEYDFFEPRQVKATLETKLIENLYLAGQINGTSGYEEAACQGLMAGINAALKIQNKAPLILGRDEAYIGVLIDDLITKGTQEPYRMFTSRAEHRLMLRQDNADFRLMDHGRRIGLLGDKEYEQLQKRREEFKKMFQVVKKTRYNGSTLYQHIKRPEVTIDSMAREMNSIGTSDRVAKKLAIEIKYEGYVQRENLAVRRTRNLDNKRIPVQIDFMTLNGLSREAKEKFNHVRPVSVGQASRISGISPCDISLLMVHIEKLAQERSKK